MPECWGCQVRPHEAEKCERLSGGTWDRHHVLPQSVIRRECADRLLAGDELLGDPRNMVWMRRYHHFALEGRVTMRVYLEQVPAEAFEFARGLGLTARLERLYPSAVSIVSGSVQSVTADEFRDAIDFLSRMAVTPASDVEGDEMREERWEP